ncbi:DoxX family protein [Candidatus Parcubacteria bacterium]|nr:DoxX family protein [Candidatus Parcubacteria bacterium]
MAILNRDKSKNTTLFLLRLAASYIFIQSGGLLLFGWFGGMPAGVPVTTLLTIAGILELVGGVAILLGIFTRPVAFILAGEMAVAYFIGHAMPMGHMWVPLLNQGEPAMLLCFIFLYFAARGAGSLSLDAKLRKAY